MTADTTLITIIVNGVLTPVLVLLTMWMRSTVSTKQRILSREDGFISGLEKRIISLEREIREVRVELKNRDGEYLEIYKEYTTLKAKYEVLLADHEDLKRQHLATATELANLKQGIEKRATEVVQSMQNL